MSVTDAEQHLADLRSAHEALIGDADDAYALSALTVIEQALAKAEREAQQLALTHRDGHNRSQRNQA